ncbi:tight junction protein ZO-1-like isoform X4 [Tachypleus tridentatus]|uniref:tight junction protein ZO-1-like isoform X4 n=1 Tax=Tachypleus tridentatus TaxID=6853 RepID=UPI003FCF29C6
MANSNGFVKLLDRHKDKIGDLNLVKLIPVLYHRGLLSEHEERNLWDEKDPFKKSLLLVNIISKKGIGTFREFCVCLESICPNLLTTFLLDSLGTDSLNEDKAASQALKLGLELALRERNSVLRENAQAREERDKAMRQCQDMKIERDRAMASLGGLSPKFTNKELGLNCSDPNSRGSSDSLEQDKLPLRNQLSEAFIEPVEEASGERITWENHSVTINRVPGYGFGIAVSGGRDNPHFANGEPSIAISDVLKAGPAEGKLQVNDRVVSVNGISLENVDYSTAVQVLRESGSVVNLEIKRRVLTNSSGEDSQTFKVTLTKNKKKEDFGIVLGCKIYIKEFTKRLPSNKDGTLQEGDIIVKINNNNTENINLRDAKKFLDAAKEKLQLVVRRENIKTVNNNNNNNLQEIRARLNKETSPTNFIDVSSTRPQWSNQNLYVQTPTRGDLRPPLLSDQSESKNNLTKVQSGRNRGPLMGISLGHLDQPATPLLTGHGHSRGLLTTEGDKPSLRPPLPRVDELTTNARKDHSDKEISSRRNRNALPDPRLVSFQKDGSVGIRLTGGNEAGIFVTSVQPGSPASLQGLQSGDKVLKVNNKDMKGVTREEAVMLLMNSQDHVELIVQHRKEEYDEIVATQRGDSFNIRTHFCLESHESGEISFTIGEIFHIVDTLYKGIVGSWLGYRLDHNNHEVQKGVIPNSSKAEKLAQQQQSQRKKDSSVESRGSFFKRKGARRSKSLSKDHWEEVMFADGTSKFPAYERVILKHTGFIRPVVLFGALADVARSMLLTNHSDKFGSPQLDNELEETLKGERSSRIVRLSDIKNIIDKGKHAVLDITPNAVDRLNYAQFYPIVIFLKTENKQLVKDLRLKLARSSCKNYKKLYEHAVKLEKMWSHIFTETITIVNEDSWYKKLLDTISKQQQQIIWISESKPEKNISDDFLFPMTLRLSYASSPESDVDLVSDYHPLSMQGDVATPSIGVDQRLVKASSDPSIATQEDIMNNPGYASSSSQQQQQIIASPTLQLQLEHSVRDQNWKLVPNSRQSPDKNGRENLLKTYHRSNMNPYNTVTERNRTRVNGEHTGLGTPPSEPEPPPLIDRSSKPQRFRSAQEKLYMKTGRSNARDFEMPDYINTVPSRSTILDRSNIKSDRVRTSEQYVLTTNQNVHPLPGHHHFTKGSTQSSTRHVEIDSGRHSQVNPRHGLLEEKKPPSPPPKSANFGSGTSSSRPIPPPKPAHYQNRLWRQDDLTDGIRKKTSQENFYHRKYNSQDGSGHGPVPGFYHTRSYSGVEAPPPPRPPPPLMRNTHLQPPPIRRDLEDVRYSSKQGNSSDFDYHLDLHSHIKSRNDITNMPSSYTSNLMNGTGPYQNIPHGSASNPYRYDMAYSQEHNASSSPPPGLLDLFKRENRGSAFELYKKLDSSLPTGTQKLNLSPFELTGPLSSDSMDSNHRVVATARGIFNHSGGTLMSEETGVQIVIPPGALPEGSDQEIYFKVCQDTSMLPPLDKEKGEMLLSPLVMCGPHGLKFNIPVELRLPHCASVNPESWSFALKSSDTPGSGQPGEWHNVSLDNMNGVASSHIKEKYVSVLVDHF